MSRKTYYYFTLSDGSKKCLTIQEAREHPDQVAIRASIEKLIEASKTPRRKSDSIKSGFHAGIGEHVRGPKHFEQLLKEKNLAVADTKPTQGMGKDINYFDDSILKEAHDMGAEFSGREVEALKSGKL